MIARRFLCSLFFIATCSSTLAADPVAKSSLVSTAGSSSAVSADTSFPIKDTLEASVHRGTIAFDNYCSLCHGITAEGNGRAAKMYTPRPYNLRQSMMSDAYKEQIIRKGGKAVGRSEFMPPWGEELTDEQVRDLINFLRTIAPAGAAK